MNHVLFDNTQPHCVQFITENLGMRDKVGFSQSWVTYMYRLNFMILKASVHVQTNMFVIKYIMQLIVLLTTINHLIGQNFEY